MSRKPALTLAIVMLLVSGQALAACNAKASHPMPELKPEASAPVQGSTAPQISNVVVAQASILPRRKADLGFAVSGRVADIKVTEGQTVSAGQELARLDAPSLRNALRRTQAGLAVAQAQLAKTKAGARTEELGVYSAAVASASAGLKASQAALQVANIQTQPEAQAGVQAAEARLAQAEAQLNLVKAGARDEDIAVAEAAVIQAEAVMADAQDALDESVLKAPFDGVVGAVLVNQGEVVSPSTIVLTIGDMKQLRAQLQDMGEQDISRVRVGQTATIHVNSLPDQTIQGHVVAVLPGKTDQLGNTEYSALVDLDAAPSYNLQWGMTASVDLATD